MSTYQVQQCLFDYLRALEGAPDGERPSLSIDGYALTSAERQALLDGDVASLYALGTHPVLINGYCRAQGYRRADYRVLFGPEQVRPEGRGRWQAS